MTTSERDRDQWARRKARRRQGYIVLPVEVHLTSLVTFLLAAGRLTEKDANDKEAVAAALALYISREVANWRRPLKKKRVLKDDPDCFMKERHRRIIEEGGWSSPRFDTPVWIKPKK
jgi:hypothetical protein